MKNVVLIFASLLIVISAHQAIASMIGQGDSKARISNAQETSGYYVAR